MRNRTLAVSLTLAVMIGVVVMTSCEPDRTGVPAQVATTETGTLQRALQPVLGTGSGLVTRAGGTVQLITMTNTLLGSRLVVPPNAVDTTTQINFTLIEELPQGLNQPLNRGYYFSPDAFTFLRSCTLYVSFMDANLGTNDPSLYRFWYHNEVTNNWEPQPTSVDVNRQEFIVLLEHFSRYAFGR